MKGKPVGHQFDSCLSDLQRATVQRAYTEVLRKQTWKNGLQTPIWIQANGRFGLQILSLLVLFLAVPPCALHFLYHPYTLHDYAFTLYVSACIPCTYCLPCTLAVSFSLHLLIFLLVTYSHNGSNLCSCFICSGHI